eukprot:605374-Lingulodinium_polyedra.AAC.1
MVHPQSTRARLATQRNLATCSESSLEGQAYSTTAHSKAADCLQSWVTSLSLWGAGQSDLG